MVGGVTGHADAAAVGETVGLLVQHREEAKALRVQLDTEFFPDLPAQPGDVALTGFALASRQVELGLSLGPHRKQTAVADVDPGQ